MTNQSGKIWEYPIKHNLTAFTLFPATILRQSLFHFENGLESLDISSPAAPAFQVPILSISLMRNLVQRLSAASGEGPDCWYHILHRQVLVQSLLSRLHHSLRGQMHMDLVTAVLGLLIALAKTELGCSALLSSNLALMVWLPLSDVKQATKEWLPVFQLGIQVNCQCRYGYEQSPSLFHDLICVYFPHLLIFSIADLGMEIK